VVTLDDNTIATVGRLSINDTGIGGPRRRGTRSDITGPLVPTTVDAYGIDSRTSTAAATIFHPRPVRPPLPFRTAVFRPFGPATTQSRVATAAPGQPIAAQT
jgi:hypothetical protein